MRNKNLDWDEGGSYDYSPNELAELSVNDSKKYWQIMDSNFESRDDHRRWQERNVERAKEFIEWQRRKY